MLLEPLTKGPCRFPYVLHVTHQPVTFIPVNYSAFLTDIVLVLRCHYEGFDGNTTPEMGLYTYLATNVLNTFTETLCVGSHQMDVVVVDVGAVAVVITPGLEFGLCTTLFEIVSGSESFWPNWGNCTGIEPC